MTSSFAKDVILYANRIRSFGRVDWLTYAAWVGLMLGLLLAVSGFVWVGWSHGVVFPSYVWNVPAGTAVFVTAIAFDTIGHRTVYKEEIARGENLVHHITIFAGISSCIVLCLAYSWPGLLRIPALSLVGLSVFYSVVDEALHWWRYLRLHSDRVEMWSHFFIFLGHTVMIFAWYHWFDQGYPGVAETLRYLPKP